MTANYTPILIRKKEFPDIFNIKYIEIKDLVPDDEKFDDYKSPDTQVAIITNTDIWSNNKWNPIKFCIRFINKSQMFRVNTQSSFIDIAENQSLLLKNNIEIPSQFSINHELSSVELPNINSDNNCSFNNHLECANSVNILLNKTNKYVHINLNENAQPSFSLSDIFPNNICRNVSPISYIGKYIYTLKTENLQFSAGIGKLLLPSFSL